MDWIDLINKNNLYILIFSVNMYKIVYIGIIYHNYYLEAFCAVKSTEPAKIISKITFKRKEEISEI